METMACAVEQASVVLLCFTERYKNSPNCRLGQSTLSSTLASCTVRFLNTISQTICSLRRRNVCHFASTNISINGESKGVVGQGRGGTASPPFFDRGTRHPLPDLFGLKFVQKLVHFCNWLLTEMQCMIISVQQN